MLFKKQKKIPVFQMAVLPLVIAFAFFAGACADDDLGGKVGGNTSAEETETITNYSSGPDALSWGLELKPLTLGLNPGNNTTEINLNWYSAGASAGKTAQVRFIRGTIIAGTELIEETGAVSNAATGYSAHKVTITGLKPGFSYQYAVSNDGDNWSPLYNFKVPAATGAFRFAVIADPQLHASTWDALNRYHPVNGDNTGAGWEETMKKIEAANVSFIVSGGDQVDASAGNEAEYTLFYAPTGLRSIPFAPVSGNHDNHLNFNYHYNLPNVQEFADETVPTAARRNYFYLYNNILFVVLNTAPYATTSGNHLTVFPVADAKLHIDRFESTIQAAKAKFAGKYDWLIVQHHKSTASVADHCADRDIQGYVEAGFEKLMSDENVDFVLAGHDHVYARSYPLSGRDGGKVSVPIKTGFNKASGSTWNNPGNPIYLTFTTGSGLKYYAVAADKTSVYKNTLYVGGADPTPNTAYPYLDNVTDQEGTSSTHVGSTDYLTGDFLPVSNAAFVQPYIPSYTIVDVNGKTITFKTYAIATVSSKVDGAEEGYNFNANTPYDSITVTKN
ncbi:MAG: metallophosphoesterase [Treponema sp.]|nr:metallophosphoesterase [Treponema sp.]